MLRSRAEVDDRTCHLPISDYQKIWKSGSRLELCGVTNDRVSCFEGEKAERGRFRGRGKEALKIFSTVVA